jgi:hypothetical protein
MAGVSDAPLFLGDYPMIQAGLIAPVYRLRIGICPFGHGIKQTRHAGQFDTLDWLNSID